MPVPRAQFFASAVEFREWLEVNHDRATEILVGFYKIGSGRPSITWPEAVDQALCYGWIDGVRRRIDEASYSNRFTPRRRKSNWSAVNIGRVGELQEVGLMQPSGLRAFDAREHARSVLYSYEQRTPRLDEGFEQKFRADKSAWEFFQAQPASHRKTATWWVVSAKREMTRLRRLEKLIEDSAQGQRLAMFAPRR